MNISEAAVSLDLVSMVINTEEKAATAYPEEKGQKSVKYSFNNYQNQSQWHSPLSKITV